MTVVSDAGPLIALAKIGGLKTLHRLYPRILIAPAVYREAVEVGLHRGDPDADALRLFAAEEKLVLTAPRPAALDRWQRPDSPATVGGTAVSPGLRSGGYGKGLLRFSSNSL